jgi:hypothetical protein
MRAMRKEQNFDCPVCHGGQYVRHPYSLPDGSRPPGSFFRCTRCDFGFTEPPMFQRNRHKDRRSGQG